MINKLKSAVETAKRVTQRTIKAAKNTVKILVKSSALLTNPLTWIVAGAIAIGLGIFSTMQNFGHNQFSDVCSFNGAPNLYGIKDEGERTKAVAAYMNTSGINYTPTDVASAYIGLIFNKGENYSYSNIDTNGLSNEAILNKIENGDNIELGALKFKGENAKKLLNTSIINGSDWKDTANQLSAVKAILTEERVNLGDNPDYDAINKALGVTLSDSAKEELIEEAKKIGDELEEKDNVCQKYGDGSETSRLKLGSSCKKKRSSTSAPGWIFDEKYELTSPYEYYFGGGGVHRGVDLVCTSGEGCPMYSVVDGTVTLSDCTSDTSGPANGFSPACMIEIEFDMDGETKKLMYGHNVNGSHQVEVGDEVKVGDHVADMGNTGWSTGPHLHFQIINPNGWENSDNPAPLMCNVEEDEISYIVSGENATRGPWDPETEECN